MCATNNGKGEKGHKDILAVLFYDAFIQEHFVFEKHF
jgi:hypothetical protein